MKKLTLIFMFAASVFGLSAQTSYYVSVDGDDTTGEGTIHAPFETIERGRLAARLCTGETTIWLRGGDYRPVKPLVFTPEDGGDGRGLVIRSFPGERAVISGALLLSPRWERYKNGILRASIEPLDGADMLVVDGNIRPMARYPDYDPKAIRLGGTSADATSPERVKSWKNPEGGYLHAMHAHDWGDFHYRITGKDREGNLLAEGGHQNNRRLGLHPDNRMVENIFEELDAPGEWFYDKSTSTLYYHPVQGEQVDQVRFEIARLKHLVELKGDERQPVRNITFSGIEFTGTTRTFMETYEPLLRSDWTVYRGGAVIFEGTENCAVRESLFHNLGGNAMFFSKYNRASEVTGSHFTRIGASAVCFVGDPGAVRSPSFEYREFVPLDEIDRRPGPLTDNYPSGCRVHDNLIHAIGLYEKQTAGVEISMSSGITVSHNSIYDVPRAGINVSEGTWGGHVIEYNDVFDTVKETGDHGSFNSWGRDRFWHPDRATMDVIVEAEPSLVLADAVRTVVIRGNRFRCDRGWDIDLDDGSTGYRIYDNLCLAGGIKLREGFYRVVENNILVNCTFHPHVWFAGSGDVFARNIVMAPYRPIRVTDWGTGVDHNIFTDQQALETARANGTDAGSIVTRVDFISPATGDFRVAAGSVEIFRSGFQNFDMDSFGVVSPRLRALARTPAIPLPVAASADEEGSGMIEWYGWSVKNLDTAGERSATGMDSERGVYVVAAVAFKNPLRDILHPGDVILGLAGRPVDNVEELLQASDGVSPGSEQQIVIHRDQKEISITVTL